MWRKKRARSPPAHAVRTSGIDFVFENPLDGLLWETDAIALLESKNSADTVYTKHCATSYCRYGFAYQKRTSFFTTLTRLELKPACSRDSPCPAFAAGRHAAACAKQPAATVNSVPSSLVEEVLDNWVENATRHHFLFIDAFAGFGSVTRAAADHAQPIHVVSNDLYRDRIDFDCSSTHALHTLLMMGFAQLQAETPTLRLEEVAVLFWLSVPCTTYGPQGRGFHRARGKQPTALAKKHDAMNLALAKYLYLELG